MSDDATAVDVDPCPSSRFPRFNGSGDDAWVIELHTDRPAPDGIAGTVQPGQELLVATEGPAAVGYAVWRVELDLATVDVIASAPGRDHDVAIVDALAERATGAGLAKMVVEVGEDQTALLAALQDATVLSTFMVKPTPGTAPDLPAGFAARDMTADEYAAWRRAAIEEYAQDNLARCGGNRELALQRSHESYARFLPGGAATVDTRLLTLTVDDVPAGDLWIRHHWPRYRDASPGEDQTFTFDVQVGEDRRGQGIGRAAMLAAERYALEVGDGQLGLNVFGGNDVAIGLYRSLGYRPRSSVIDVPLVGV